MWKSTTSIQVVELSIALKQKIREENNKSEAVVQFLLVAFLVQQEEGRPEVG